MSLVIADTDVLIEFLRGTEPIASEVRRLLHEERLATTSISVFELWAGARAPEVPHLETLMAALEIFQLGMSEAKEGGELSRKLRAEGRTIHTADALIAGICLKHRSTLFTRNVRHFDFVPGLKLHS